MDTIQELQVFRAQLIQEIDSKFEQMIQKLRAEADSESSGDTDQTYESIYPLNAGTGIFKGKRPTGIIFANGVRVDVPTWKKAVEEILCECNKDTEMHRKLMDLRGRLHGRNRVLLGSEEGRMRSPVKIDRALYVETHYDTESLLRILTTRILSAVGYDYSGIQVAVRNE